MIEFKNVSLSYNNKQVLKKINLTIKDDEFCVLIGASGCGKTTLLKLINKLNKATSGKVLIDDQEISKLSLRGLPAKIGYVVQEAGLFPHLTAGENIALALKLAHWPKREIKARVDEMLNLVNLDADLYRNLYPSQMSGGQRQRVGVARAFAPNPPIILMDEPFSALDPVTRSDLQDEISKLQQTMHKTIVFVTHDMDEAIKLADKICILENGTIAQIGTPAEILKHPVNSDIEEFIGTDKLWSNPDLIRVEEIMLKDPLCIESDASMHKARLLMKQKDLPHIFVTDQGKLKGLVYLQEIKWAWGSGNFDKYLHTEIPSIKTKDTLQDVINGHDYGKADLAAVVDDEGMLRGYLTRHLLLSLLSRQFVDEDAKAGAAEAEVKAVPAEEPKQEPAVKTEITETQPEPANTETVKPEAQPAAQDEVRN